MSRLVAEFTVTAPTMRAEGGTQLALQPVGEPNLRLLEVADAAEDGTLGEITLELDEGVRYIPKPGETVRLHLSKVREGSEG